MIEMENNLKEFSELHSINKEILLISSSLETQKNLNAKLFIDLKRVSEKINPLELIDTKSLYHYLNHLSSLLKKSDYNIHSLEDMLTKLISIQHTLAQNIEEYHQIYLSSFDNISYNNSEIEVFLKDPQAETNSENFQEEIPVEFVSVGDQANSTELNLNENQIDTSSKILQEQNNNTTEETPTNTVPMVEENQKIENDQTTVMICENPTELWEEQNNIIAEETQQNTSELPVNEEHKLVENSLVISEVLGKVILPYTKREIEDILKKLSGKYVSAEDVIERVYTLPLKYYKASSVARFKEAYKLIKEKEHGSTKEALDLAFELFSNYNLHPAIITACKNINELDIYLSCLEYNELDDFHFFKIIFHSLPTTKPKYHIFKNKKLLSS